MEYKFLTILTNKCERSIETIFNLLILLKIFSSK